MGEVGLRPPAPLLLACSSHGRGFWPCCLTLQGQHTGPLQPPPPTPEVSSGLDSGPPDPTASSSTSTRSACPVASAHTRLSQGDNRCRPTPAPY